MGAGPFPYAFRSPAKPAREFVRVLKRISARLAKLARRGPAHRTEAVHEIRTLIKLLRALLWFARPALPPTTVAYAKIELHNAARLLSARRDVTAMQTVLQDLAGEAQARPEREALARAGRLVARHAPRFKEAALLRQQAQAVVLAQKTIRLLIHAAATDTNWKNPARRFDQALAQAVGAQTVAEQQPTPIHLHEWRKKVKRVLYLLQILHPKPKRKIRRALKGVDKLQEHLGDHHDAVLLEEHFARYRPELASDPALQPIFALLHDRQRQLQKKAEKIARKL